MALLARVLLASYACPRSALALGKTRERALKNSLEFDDVDIQSMDKGGVPFRIQNKKVVGYKDEEEKDKIILVFDRYLEADCFYFRYQFFCRPCRQHPMIFYTNFTFQTAFLLVSYPFLL